MSLCVNIQENFSPRTKGHSESLNTVKWVHHMFTTLRLRERSTGELCNKVITIIIIMYFHSVDATKDNGRLGRLINHSRTAPNAITRVQEEGGLPHLFLFASKHIKKGEEVLFDYGDRSTEVVVDNPWLNS